MGRDFKKDLKSGLYKNPDNIASLIPYMLDDMSYALPIDSSPTLRKHIAAAIFKCKTPHVKYEEILSEVNKYDYSDVASYSQYEMVIHVITDQAVMNSLVLSNYNEWCVGSGLNRDLFMASMVRLQSSFKSAAILLNTGFFVEVSSIFRLILEQLAWVCYLIGEPDKSQIEKKQTQKCIDSLKMVLGNDYGKLYGILSSEAHLEPKEIGKYLDSNKNQLVIKNRSGKKCEEETWMLLLLLEAYGKIVWYSMEHWGLPDEYSEYFRDWHELSISMCVYLREVLTGDVQLERSSVPSP